MVILLRKVLNIRMIGVTLVLTQLFTIPGKLKGVLITPVTPGSSIKNWLSPN